MSSAMLPARRTMRRISSSVRFARLSAAGALLLSVSLGAGGCESMPCEGAACEPGSAAGDAGTSQGAGAAAGSGGTGSGGSAGSSNGQSGPCQSSANCDTEHGFACVAAQCRHECRSHYDCAGLGTCEPLAGETANYCVLGEAAEAGGYYTYCPNGDECAADFVCLGSGPGDARAYCSGACTGDVDCPAGFQCDTISDADGNPVPFCVRRSFCASCESDADCLAVPGQICARDQSGAKICTKTCDPGVDSCPWGNASICGLYDQELGVPTCAHRFGSCTGEGKTCEPCARDADCPTGFCHGSSYTSERWCVDTSVECSCAGLPTEQQICEGDNGCPESPGGASVMCFDNERYPGDPFGYHCFGASTQTGFNSPQAGCWDPL